MDSGLVQAEIDSFWELTGGGESPTVELTGSVPGDRSAFRVGLAASAASSSVPAAVADILGMPSATLDPALALAGFCGYVRREGEKVPAWAPLSGYYRTADDRLVQLHCNFAHHAAGVAARLGVPEDREAFERAIATWKAEELETALIDDGMIAAVCRTLEEWDDHPHAMAVADLPLLSVDRLAVGPRGGQLELDVDLPLAGVRVLDCSRVLAGPVAGQTLANLGADVMRVGAEHLPFVDIGVMATGTSKRNVNIDLRTPEGRTSFTQLLERADVMIDGFRPGALEDHGFGPDEVARVAPQCSVVQISAFDRIGSWAGRRGYDSIVQSTTGIVRAGMEAATADMPTPLPVQALDYTTGFFAAAAAIRAIERQRRTGESVIAQLSLIRTRNWLVGLGGPAPFTPQAITPEQNQLAIVSSDFGDLELVRPFVGTWRWGPRLLGADTAAWQEA
ncbi:MAG: CoA transferase [Acidimicrobiales bacterium]